ncbi:hypothetical protein BDN67DRAFT_966138 [Paxillus ammoniavirescens]|nr:hypothetical protein BDN67DRAFT_966138 [Paxillus ammoniavirescens]
MPDQVPIHYINYMALERNWPAVRAMTSCPWKTDLNLSGIVAGQMVIFAVNRWTRHEAFAATASTKLGALVSTLHWNVWGMHDGVRLLGSGFWTPARPRHSHYAV